MSQKPKTFFLLRFSLCDVNIMVALRGQVQCNLRNPPQKNAAEAQSAEVTKRNENM